MQTLVATPDPEPTNDKLEEDVWTVRPNRADFRRNGLLSKNTGRGRVARSAWRRSLMGDFFVEPTHG